MSVNILIVEDERIVSMEIESYLTKLGYRIVGICSDADMAVSMALSSDVDLILMDIFLVESDGIEAVERIKKVKSNMPVIFLTAHMDEDTINRAILVNPSSYLLKPFNRNELGVAIKLALRQNALSPDDTVLIGDIRLDSEFSFNTMLSKLICCGENIALSKKEKMLLNLFLDNQNMLISFMKMEYEIWPDKPSSSSRRRTLISRLRAKLKHKFIETCPSEGYIFKKASQL
ncbi:MAG: response regulator [Sulfurovaceae bacterium]|nr:response regulator [Sulfurovaceae bacterium]